MADVIIHAGDLVSDYAFDLLEAVGKPLFVVTGNADHRMRRTLPRCCLLECGVFRVEVMHGHDVGTLPPEEAAWDTFRLTADIAIFGHSHRSLNQWRIPTDGSRMLLFNPGSATDPRGSSGPSYGLLRITNMVDATVHTF